MAAAAAINQSESSLPHASDALRRLRNVGKVQLRVSERSFNGRLMEVPTLETDEMSDWLDAAARHAHALDCARAPTEGQWRAPERLQIEIQANSTCDD